MVCEICKNEVFLAQKADSATPEDLGTARDLLDTLIAHKAGCVGMAANMIGVNKRIIAFDNEGEYMVMFNPSIVRQSGAYEAEEACLSLAGTRKTKRFQTIKVQWQNEKFQTRCKAFTGWTAEIIQHEIDHCEGVLILISFRRHPITLKAFIAASKKVERINGKFMGKLLKRQGLRAKFLG